MLREMCHQLSDSLSSAGPFESPGDLRDIWNRQDKAIEEDLVMITQLVQGGKRPSAPKDKSQFKGFTKDP